MKRKLSTSILSPIVDDPHLIFKCGCGTQFSCRDSFKEHSLLLHNGKYIKDSTHFLSCLTNIVLPAQQGPESPPLSQQQEKENSCEKICAEKEPQEIVSVTHKQSMVLRSQYTKEKNIKEKEKYMHEKLEKKGKSMTLSQKTIKVPQKVYEQIEWNGFKLIQNKEYCSEQFFCGCCRTTFSQAQQMIIHCIEVCQQLKHPLSSHFVTCTIDPTQTQQKIESNQPQISEVNALKRCLSIKNIQRSHLSKQFASEKIIQQHKQQKLQSCPYDPVRQIFSRKWDHKQVPFFCGCCNKFFQKPKDYYRDIMFNHSQLVTSLSSHVILRLSMIKSHPNKVDNVYLSSNVQWRDSNALFYCPCKADAKMTMDKLIQHIMVVHRGISPKYSFQRIEQNNNHPNHPNHPNKKVSIQCVANINQYQPQKLNCVFWKQLRQIYKKKQDHRNVPFQCKTCNLTYEDRTKYKDHFKKIDHNKFAKLQCSHVILSTIFNRDHNELRNFFFSPSVEWPNKNKIYNCPCQPKKRMIMSDLLQHHMDIHKGLSPLYDFPSMTKE